MDFAAMKEHRTSRFCLPQMNAQFGREAAVEQILVLGGRMPDAAWLREAASGKRVCAADSGVDACRIANVRPDHALGDFDSIGDEGRRWLERLGIRPELYPADKDYTDFQLCLKGLKGDILVTGCWGGRFDHAFGNIFSALWGEEWGVRVRAFADETEVLFPLFEGEAVELTFYLPVVALSLLPLTAVCGGVTVEGVRWELHDAELPQSHPWTISNRPLGESVRVKAGSGVLGVYCLFREKSLRAGCSI
ncbi:MAG: thiamine diphosphokinase [Synergistaceae bacterium]|jgi:thiamine pyrophosphokinase|nr:thiamine diphosphokinase [Synergistaceae bacterium]